MPVLDFVFSVVFYCSWAVGLVMVIVGIFSSMLTMPLFLKKVVFTTLSIGSVYGMACFISYIGSSSVANPFSISSSTHLLAIILSVFIGLAIVYRHDDLLKN